MSGAMWGIGDEGGTLLMLACFPYYACGAESVTIVGIRNPLDVGKCGADLRRFWGRIRHSGERI
jgi:hypothetical protein